MQQILKVHYVETKAAHWCRIFPLLRNAKMRHLVIPCTYADSPQLPSSLYLSFVRHFVCNGANPLISSLAPDDSEWLASSPGRFSSRKNTIGTRRIGAQSNITATLIAINKGFWPGLLLYYM